MNMHDLQDILQYAEACNMMDCDFQTVLQSYDNFLQDYYESIVADNELMRQEELDFNEVI